MLIEELVAIVGPANVLTGEQVSARAVGWADCPPCEAQAYVRPGHTETHGASAAGKGGEEEAAVGRVDAEAVQ